jgi:hypothetical protein
VIKKCTTKGCELSEEELKEKLEDADKKAREKELEARKEADKKAAEDKKKAFEAKLESMKMQVSAPAASPVMLFSSENQDKLFDYINSPSINSLAFRGHKDDSKKINVENTQPIYPAKDSKSEILPYNQRDHAWNEEQHTNSSETSW